MTSTPRLFAWFIFCSKPVSFWVISVSLPDCARIFDVFSPTNDVWLIISSWLISISWASALIIPVLPTPGAPTSRIPCRSERSNVSNIRRISLLRPIIDLPSSKSSARRRSETYWIELPISISATGDRGDVEASKYSIISSSVTPIDSICWWE